MIGLGTILLITLSDFSDHNILLLSIKGIKSHVKFGQKTFLKTKTNIAKVTSYFENKLFSYNGVDAVEYYNRLEKYILDGIEYSKYHVMEYDKIILFKLGLLLII